MPPSQGRGSRGLPLLQVGLGAVCLAAVVGILRWSIVSDGAPIRGPGIESAARLMCGCLAFWLAGRALIRIGCAWCGRHEGGLTIGDLQSHLLAIGLGQVFAVIWIALRSGMSEISTRVFGMPLPISGVEVAALFGACLISFVLESRVSASSPQPGVRRAYWLNLAGLLLLIVLVCLATGLREMPRVSTLSSDPDLHAYWSRVVMRLGGIPWDQGVLGIGSFGYPGGYASLNASWCALTGITVVDAVTIQPVLQSLLACLVIASAAPLCVTITKGGFSRHSNRDVLALALLLLLVFWFAFPFGMQRDRYFSWGTARLSTTMIIAVIIVFWLAPTGFALRGRERAIRLGVMSFSLAALVLFNPLTAVVPAIPVLVTGLVEIGRTLIHKWSPDGARVPALAILATTIGFLGVVAGDPYFGERLLPKRHSVVSVAGVSADTQEAAASLSLHSLISTPSEPLLPLFAPMQFCSYLNAGIGSPIARQIGWGVAVALAVVPWLLRRPRCALRWLVLLPIMSGVFAAALSIERKAYGDLPLHLVQPYLTDSTYQTGVVMAFTAIAAGLAMAIHTQNLWSRLALVAASATIAILPRSTAAAGNPAFTMTPRVLRLDGNMGVPTESDRECIRHWNSMAQAIVDSNPGLSHAEAPKILILGIPRELNLERWVFPVGGARLLALDSPLPTAFFYTTGSTDWTYENYINRVCNSFDQEWLRTRNVKYIFVPEDRRGCLHDHTTSLETRFRVIHQVGEAVILEIPE